MIATENQSLSPDVRVELFIVDATQVGAGVLRFTPTSVSGQPLVFDGHEYTPVPVKAEGFAWVSGGTLPRPTLTLAIADHAFADMAMLKRLSGCEVTLLRTFRKYLDDGSHPNPTAIYPPDVYVINKRASETKNEIVYELTPRMDRERRMIPAIQVLRDSCKHSFRRWDGDKWSYRDVSCPYAGDEMYDEHGQPTDNPSLARCGKRLEDCVRHFGEDAVLPFWGFPGVGRL